MEMLPLVFLELWGGTVVPQRVTPQRGYLGHPSSGPGWRQGWKPEVGGPGLRAWGPRQLADAQLGCVVGEGGPTVSWAQLGPCPFWAHFQRRPFILLLSWELGQSQACLLVGV